MAKKDVKTFLKEAEKRVGELDVEFEESCYPEIYPGKGENIKDGKVKGKDSSKALSDESVDHFKSLEELASAPGDYRSYDTKNWLLKRIVPRLRKSLFREMDYRYGLLFQNQKALNGCLVDCLKTLQDKMDGLSDESDALNERIDGVRGELDASKNKKDGLKEGLDALSERIRILKEELVALDAKFQSELKEVVYPDLPIDWFEFEKEFRGDEQEVSWRFDKYIKYFKDKKKVLDVGCGRGEFLDACAHHGVGAIGVDLDEKICKYVKTKGHKVLCEDAIGYLEGLSVGSLDGVFAAHLLEHLTEKDLLKIVSLFYDKLSFGDHCVIETPNAESLEAMSKWFYLDPTHRKPLHPRFLEFVFNGAGFSKVEILRVEYESRDKPTEVEKLIFGAPDFAIIAKK